MEAGLTDVLHGVPFLPGTMSLMGRIPGPQGDMQVLGVPACALYFKTTFLDLVLPQVNGLNALSYLRQHSDVGVIMISSCANQQQRLHGLREGADDFISKPVKTDELVFKEKSLAARVGHQHGQADRQFLAVGNCILLADEHTIARTDEKARFTLTEAEQRILVLLSQHSPQVCSRKSLLHCISRTEISMGNERSVDTLVGRIRRKLKQLDCTATISSVRGQGYRLQID